MIKAIIFDCFSVLVGDSVKALQSELTHQDPDKGEQFAAISRAYDRGILPEDSAIESHAELLGLTPDKLREIRNQGEVRNAELIDYIEESLKGRYKLAVLSNISSRERMEKRFLPGELDRIFDTVVISGEIGHIKPYPEIFNAALERLDVAPDECVMIDDIEQHCQGARAVGMHAIQFISNTQVIQDLTTLIDSGGERE